MRGKKILIHLTVGVAVPVLLLLNAFVIPEPYSHPLIDIGLAPIKLMPFLESRELMSYLTQVLFGRMTPNFAPIQMIFLILFWFLISMAASILYTYIKDKHKNT